MKIIFKNQDNSIGIITPTEEAIKLTANLGIYNSDKELIGFKEITYEEFIEVTKEALPIIAQKDVPQPFKYATEWKTVIDEDTKEEYVEVVKYETYNTPYWIVEDSAIPTDRTFRDAWSIDESQGEPDGFGGESNEFDAELLATYKESLV